MEIFRFFAFVILMCSCVRIRVSLNFFFSYKKTKNKKDGKKAEKSFIFSHSYYRKKLLLYGIFFYTF